MLDTYLYIIETYLYKFRDLFIDLSGRRVEGELISSSNNTTMWVIPRLESFSFGDMSTKGHFNAKYPNTIRPARRSWFPSASERPSKQKCKKCGTHGHNSSRCLNPSPSSNSTISDAYCRKCSLWHLIGHNKKTCPKKDEIVGHNL